MALPEVKIEAAFSVNTTSAFVLDDVVKGKLDTATLSDEVWTDITDFAYDFDIKRGATRAEGPLLRFEASTLQVTLDNSDRRFDPTNLLSPYVVANRTQVLPMRPVRVSAIYGGAIYPLFTGFVDTWSISLQGPSVSTCTMTATDATKVLSDYDRPAGPAVGASELSGARVHRVLNSVSWPLGQRDIDAGQSTLQATTMDRSAWEELTRVQDSEIGQIFVDARGYVVFRDRQANMRDPRSTQVQAAFGDAVGEVPFVDHSIKYDDDGLYNDVRIANTGGIQQSAVDLTSKQQYLTHTYERTDLLLENDEAAADYGGFILLQCNSPELRFTDLVLDGNDEEMLGQALGREFGDLVTITRRPPAGWGTSLVYDWYKAEDRALVNSNNNGWTFDNNTEPVPYGWRLFIDGNAVETNKHVVIGPSFQVPEGAVIRVSLDYFRDGNSPNYDLFYGVRWYNAANEVISWESQGYVSKTGTIGAWQTTTVDVVAIEGAAWGYVAMYGMMMDGVANSGRWWTRYPRATRIGTEVTRRCFIVGVQHRIAGPGEWKTTFALQSATNWKFFTLNDATLGVIDANYLAF